LGAILNLLAAVSNCPNFYINVRKRDTILYKVHIIEVVLSKIDYDDAMAKIIGEFSNHHHNMAVEMLLGPFHVL